MNLSENPSEGLPENRGSLESRGVGKTRLAISAVLALFTVLLWGWFYTGKLRAEEIISPSMAPSINVGDRIIVEMIEENDVIERGDIIVFDSPDDDNPLPLIKRVVGLPGDFIFYRNDKVYINDLPSVEKLKEDGNFPILMGLNIRLPEDSFFVLGDNSERSHDSRAFGPIQRQSVLGKALLRYYPFKEAGWFEKTEIDGHEENIIELESIFAPSV